MTVYLNNYELRWPTALFVSEGHHLAHTNSTFWYDQVIWLLTEALVGTTAVADFKELPAESDTVDDPWSDLTPQRVVTQREWFTELISRAGELRKEFAPAPYWPQRRGHESSAAGGGPRNTRRAFVRIIKELFDSGYLSEAFGEECVDEANDLPDASEVIERRLGIPELWPLDPEAWDEDTFYGLVEVFHDLVSRPRRRSWHSFGSEWHHYEFNSGPARILYRWKVNKMLRASGIDYELSDEGTDLGRLVAVTDDARAQLVHQSLSAPHTNVKERTGNAITLFRGRTASVEIKRSAIVILAGILEERRPLLKEILVKKDEGALFHIMNEFTLRHRDARQQGDYDEAFLDWFFWWFLATVELTNRVISSRANPDSSGPNTGTSGDTSGHRIEGRNTLQDREAFP
ncbi:hypothetical protein [Streptomyces anulatus]|uniref:hypothetical protein n=1 Tax=Streptomyces anulatus TaxID=1892 RepID=UPI00344678B3|nr:hypothetical protein OG238_00095 [Streptomyces anulatus]WST90436.1 hypothetical protein OG238_41435 [Streptomyces anulatus]